MVTTQTEYDETLWAAREAERDRRLEAKLKRQAQRLGFELVPIDQRPAPDRFLQKIEPKRTSSSRVAWCYRPRGVFSTRIAPELLHLAVSTTTAVP
jgi:hypothetical protein